MATIPAGGSFSTGGSQGRGLGYPWTNGRLTRLDSMLRDIDHEHVDGRLRWSDLQRTTIPSRSVHRSSQPRTQEKFPPGQTYHVLLRRNKLHHPTVQLCPRPPISRLVGLVVPVKQLRNLVGQVTHATLPPGSTLDEGDVGVDV